MSFLDGAVVARGVVEWVVPLFTGCRGSDDDDDDDSNGKGFKSLAHDCRNCWKEFMGLLLLSSFIVVILLDDDDSVHSWVWNPNSRAKQWTVVDLPMPGRPTKINMGGGGGGVAVVVVAVVVSTTVPRYCCCWECAVIQSRISCTFLGAMTLSVDDCGACRTVHKSFTTGGWWSNDMVVEEEGRSRWRGGSKVGMR